MSEIDTSRLPKHIAVIMDGNGRWAKKKSLPRIFGHRQGVKTVKEIVKAAGSLGIKVLTLYAFSTENWKRPVSEIDALFSLLIQFLKKEFDELSQNGVKLRILGNMPGLPQQVQNDLKKACDLTENNEGLQLNIALNYGARQELIECFKALCEKGITSPSERDIANFLYTKGQPDPDLLIRTSGESRISNFLLWQIAYCEIYFTEKLWPDFTKEDLEQAVIEFQKRERRFGAV